MHKHQLACVHTFVSQEPVVTFHHLPSADAYTMQTYSLRCLKLRVIVIAVNFYFGIV